MATQSTTTAPSAAPAAVAPAKPATPMAPAPSAVVIEPAALNDFVELARQSIAGELPATPSADPAPTGQEPSPAEPAPDPAEPSPEPTPTAAGDEPTPDEMANWTEGERKMHAVMLKERQESKEARAELREIREKLAELEKQNKPPTAPQAEPDAPVTQAQPAPSAGDVLADCPTFEAVDARVQSAASVEAQAVRLQNMLLRNGLEPVVEKLKASKVETISGIPIDEASADDIGDFLATVYENARTAQAQAPVRKQWLVNNQNSLQQAVQIIPELADVNSPAYKAAIQLVQQNPLLRHRADWPVVVAKLYLGEQAFLAKAKPAAAPAAKPAARPAARPAPGAPRAAVSALPTADTKSALAQKIADGTATMQEVQQYALADIRA